MPTIVRVAHFDIDRSRKLGEGGFGKVFFAKDISEDPPAGVAVQSRCPLARRRKPISRGRWG
jgi:hypothetical protein